MGLPILKWNYKLHFGLWIKRSHYQYVFFLRLYLSDGTLAIGLKMVPTSAVECNSLARAYVTGVLALPPLGLIFTKALLSLQRGNCFAYFLYVNLST